MSDPVRAKVSELCAGYPPEFNAQAAYELVLSAWRMGFDVVKAPADSALYTDAVKKIVEEQRNTFNHAAGLQQACK
jgi:hypothetical protein